MKAIIINEFGGTDKLKYSEIEKPTIGNGEVLIQVKAFSINPVDTKTRAGSGIAGRLKDIKDIILGWDVSGIVADSQSDDFKVGDEVFGMINFPGHGKAYAEYVTAPASHLALKPANISHEEAAASTLAALTVYQAFFQQVDLKKGQKVLVHGAAGGLGHFAVQIAKHAGATVIGTSSSNNKNYVLSMGADSHIDYKSQAFEDIVNDADLVFDTVGGENVLRSIASIKPGGIIISTPTTVSKEIADKAESESKKAFFFLVQSNGDDMKVLAEWLKEGIFKPTITTFGFGDIAKAHEAMESGHTRGKLVVSVN